MLPLYFTVQRIKFPNGRKGFRKIAAFRIRSDCGKGRKLITSCLCGFFGCQA